MSETNETTEVVKKKKKWLVPVIIAGTVLLILIVFGIVISTVISATTSKQDLQENLALGDKYLLDLDYENAVLAYKSAIEMDPKSEDAVRGFVDVSKAWADSLAKEHKNDQATQLLSDSIYYLEQLPDIEFVEKYIKELRDKKNEYENREKESEGLQPDNQEGAEEKNLLELGVTEDIFYDESEILFLGMPFNAMTLDDARRQIISYGGRITSDDQGMILFDSLPGFASGNGSVGFSINDGYDFRSFDSSSVFGNYMQSNNIGIRDIRFGDSPAAALTKLGFSNGQELEDLYRGLFLKKGSEAEIDEIVSRTGYHYYHKISDNEVIEYGISMGMCQYAGETDWTIVGPYLHIEKLPYCEYDVELSFCEDAHEGYVDGGFSLRKVQISIMKKLQNNN